MKKLIALFLPVLVILLLEMGISASDIKVEAADGRVFAAQDSTFILPSYIKPSGVKLIYDSGITVTYVNGDGENTTLQSGNKIDLTPFVTTLTSGQDIYELSVKIDGRANTFVFKFADSLPSVHVTTSMGIDTITASNGKDTQTQIAVINSNGTFEYADTDSTYSQLKVRGNTTKDYAKKPFQIKLDAKADLFGMGESRTWILLANYLDQSQIRNSVMYKIGSLLGMDTCEFQSVDLFVDGEYYGIYLLCEKVSISSQRIDIVELEKLNDQLNVSYEQAPVKEYGIPNTIITEYSYIPNVVNPADITGGYLVELDNNYWGQELCYFVTENGSHYVVKSPEYASKEQVEYIATLFGELEEAIMSETGYNRLGKHYSEYADVDSFVYAYIVAEFSRNYDAGSSSMYFYKDADKNGELCKIVKGPLWDCDNTIGNIHKNGASNTSGYWAKDRSIWGGLTKHEEFNQKVSEEFARVYDQIFDMTEPQGYISELVLEIGQSIHLERARWRSNNYTYWPIYYNGIHYDRWQSSPVFNFVSGKYSYDLDKDDSTVIGYLCEHIEERANWLAAAWNCDVELRERSFEIDEPIIPTPPAGDTTNSSTQDSVTTDSSTTNSSTIDSSTTNSGTTNSSTIDSSTTNSGTTDSSTVDPGTQDSQNPTDNNDCQGEGTSKTGVIVAIVLVSLAVVISVGTAIVFAVKLKKKS